MFAVIQRDGGEFHNMCHTIDLFCCHALVTSDLAAPGKKLFLFTYFGRDSANLASGISNTPTVS